MASSIIVTGEQPSARAAVILARVDYADLIATDDKYNTGGETYAALSTALAQLTWKDFPMSANDGSNTYYFAVNATTLKIQAFTTSDMGTEVTADTDMSGFTDVPILIVGE
jgi:hypothetical protein